VFCRDHHEKPHDNLASSYQIDDCPEADKDDAEPDHFVFLGVELIGVRRPPCIPSR
jgi:hypothetical protein